MINQIGKIKTFRNILKGAIEGATAVTEPFKSTVKGAIEGVKKIAKPFIKESIYIDKIMKNLKRKRKRRIRRRTNGNRNNDS